MKQLFRAALTLVVSASIAANTFGKDIVETAVADGHFKTLTAALGAAGLVDHLKTEGPFTVFAPTDEAFAKLPEGTIATLLKPENKSKLTAILTYHVVAGKVLAKDVVKLHEATTVNGQRVDIKVDGSTVTIDGATVVMTDIVCDNGVIHVIDSVILPSTKTIPETATEAGQFKTLLAAVKAAGLADVLSGEGPFTVFAPTDDAFKKLPAGTVASLLKPENKQKLVDLLKYHVVAGRVYLDDAVKAKSAESLAGPSIKFAAHGSDAMVNESKLVTPDVESSNGVIHVIDTVLMPTAETCPLSKKK